MYFKYDSVCGTQLCVSMFRCVEFKYKLPLNVPLGFMQFSQPTTNRNIFTSNHIAKTLDTIKGPELTLLELNVCSMYVKVSISVSLHVSDKQT